MVKWIVGFLLFAWAAGLYIGGYRVFAVGSGSMGPAVRVGSLVVVKPYEVYSTGDIVTFTAGGSPVTHRIVGKEGRKGIVYFATKGDANLHQDFSLISSDQIVGKVVAVLPYLGFSVLYANTEYGLIALVLAPAVGIIASELLSLLKSNDPT